MLVLNLSLGSELVPSHPAKIPFDHVILEFWKTDKVFTFAAEYILGVHAYVYAHIIKIGERVWPTSQNPYTIYDQNLQFSLPCSDLTKNSIPCY